MTAAAQRPSDGRAETTLRSLFGLDGMTAVVTGGTSGLGAAMALGLAKVGAEVVIVGRDEPRGSAVVEQIAGIGGSADLQLADLSQPSKIERLAERILSAHPAVDILVNAAGVFVSGPTSEVTVESWDWVFAVNVTATFLMCQAFGRAMIARGSGAIVNLSCTDGVVGVPGQAAYCSSKGAIIQLTRSLAVEWAAHGVRVNCLAPGEFVTPMVEPLMSQPGYLEWVSSAVPVGRTGQPEELLGALLALVGPASSMLVGHTLLVDGGRTVI